MSEESRESLRALAILLGVVAFVILSVALWLTDTPFVFRLAAQGAAIAAAALTFYVRAERG